MVCWFRRLQSWNYLLMLPWFRLFKSLDYVRHSCTQAGEGFFPDIFGHFRVDAVNSCGFFLFDFIYYSFFFRLSLLRVSVVGQHQGIHDKASEIYFGYFVWTCVYVYAFLFLLFALPWCLLILLSVFLFCWIRQDLVFIKFQLCLLDRVKSMFSIVSLCLFCLFSWRDARTLSATLLSRVCSYSLISFWESFFQQGIYRLLCPLRILNLALFSIRPINPP